MDWRWDLIAFIRKDTMNEDEMIEEDHTSVRKLREAVKQLHNDASDTQNVSEALLEIMNSSHKLMSHAASSSAELRTLRKVYTDAAILQGLLQSLQGQALSAISALDHSIIVAGPYGDGRHQMVLDSIRRLQADMSGHLRTQNATYALGAIVLKNSDPTCTIPSPKTPPPFLQFQRASPREPFVLRGFAKHWPALTSRPWRSHTYLTNVAGPGRVVPVEIGDDYRSKDWQQQIMQWDEYLSYLDFEDCPASRSCPSSLYMAQHDLMKQFPELQDDIQIPDYLYADLEIAEYPSYHPPNTEDKMIVNSWLGPKGAFSPAHVDPYFNFYVQVVGYKRVWLAPPSISHSMYPISAPRMNTTDDPHVPAMGNTSRVDVFADEKEMGRFPAFLERVLPVSMTATLGPGDALFFPSGWWHAMQCKSTSFSVSMWF